MISDQCGPGTGIDTKFNKQGTLHIPKYLYEKLMVYVQSPRYASRCNKNNISNKEDQYLFLTQHGQPFYVSPFKTETNRQWEKRY